MSQPVVTRFPRHLVKLIKSKLERSSISLPIKEHYKLLGVTHLYLVMREEKRIRVDIAGMQIHDSIFTATITSKEPNDDDVIRMPDDKVDIKAMIAMFSLQ